MNRSITTQWDFRSKSTAQFWFYYPSLLSDGVHVRPLNGSGGVPSSFFLPGGMDGILFDASQPPFTSRNYTDAVSLIQYDAPGYQIDFMPIDLEADPAITLEDCKLYGVSLQICLKKVNEWFIASLDTRGMTKQRLT